jgi:hypothetical protein
MISPQSMAQLVGMADQQHFSGITVSDYVIVKRGQRLILVHESITVYQLPYLPVCVADLQLVLRLILLIIPFGYQLLMMVVYGLEHEVFNACGL